MKLLRLRDSFRQYIAVLQGDVQGAQLQNPDELLIAELERVPILSTTMVAGIFSIFGTNKLKIEKKAREIIRRKLKLSINPSFSQKAVEYLEAGDDSKNGIRSALLETENRACPADAVIAELYASNLIQRRAYKEAYPILKRLIEARKYPPANIEFLYAQALHSMREFDLARQYYKKLIDPHDFYLSAQQKKTAARFLEAMEKQEAALPDYQKRGAVADSSNWSLIIFIISICPILIVAFVILQKKNANRRH